MKQTETRLVRIGHSPDPDDAFMFHGIATGAVDTGPFRVEQVLEEIESLNRRALRGELEVSAVSIHAYAHLAERYALMHCGASMGDGYGPCVVARRAFDPGELAHRTIAIPGTLTSAYLALRLLVGGPLRYDVLPFDRIPQAVLDGRVDAGLIIHEGQITYPREGLRLVVDLGRWWGERTGGLPLPLGGNVVRRDLGRETMVALTRMLEQSIDHGLRHRDPALAYALDFGRGLDRELTDRFVGMYVNDLTRDYGERGREAIRRFLAEGCAAGVVPPVDTIEFV
ncbi:MAG TPA: MqnA/MqnD/SBP family protein [Candidatus Polarisedimenticolaceae bacterium]|nr:MqnA/MqnD/SBP family protein [Candidatus Polarisedimenticolaceae bacterium]